MPKSASLRWWFDLVVTHGLDQHSCSTSGLVTSTGRVCWYVTSYPGQLSLAILQWIHAASSVSWGVKVTPCDDLVS